MLAKHGLLSGVMYVVRPTAVKGGQQLPKEEGRLSVQPGRLCSRTKAEACGRGGPSLSLGVGGRSVG